MKKVRDFMSTSVHAIEVGSSVHDAALLMADKSISCLIVTKNGEPEGIITERDLIRKILAKGRSMKGTKVEDIMTSPLITVDPEDDLGHVSLLMKEKGIRRLPVMSEGKLIGIVTQTDVVKITHELHEKHKKMEFYQNLQSGIVLIALILTIILLYKILS
ncbi:CBS domain-containing protein [Candidatus Woesearchaeota archaeon]|nr:MAG: CBS domain-containing protein [Candidatus Woesearchaeota archaeon]